jgi:hypothetical protein
MRERGGWPVLASWGGGAVFGLAFWYVALFGSIPAKLTFLGLLVAGLLLSIAWLARPEPEELGHVDPGTLRRLREQGPDLRVYRGGRL